MLCQFGLTGGENFFVQRTSMRIHRHDRGEILHLKLPDGFGRPEFLQKINIADALDAFRQDLRRAPDGMQKSAPRFRPTRRSATPHPALSENSAQSELANDGPLVGLFPCGGGWASRRDF